MKTIIYSGYKGKFPNSSLPKRYAVNTQDKLRKGDKFKISGNTLVVDEVLDVAYKYVNVYNGEFSNEIISTGSIEIKELALVAQNDNVLVAIKL